MTQPADKIDHPKFVDLMGLIKDLADVQPMTHARIVGEPPVGFCSLILRAKEILKLGDTLGIVHHQHRFATTVYIALSHGPASVQQCEAFLGNNFEAERDDESVSYDACNECVAILPTQVEAERLVADRDDEDDDDLPAKAPTAAA
jgi:hypothetical protein